MTMTTTRQARHGKWSRTHLVALSAMAAAALTGCGTGTLTSADPLAPVPVTGSAFAGSVYGGQAPIVGSTIQLYAASSLGYGHAAGPLLTPGSVVTVAGGKFSIGAGAYTCPSASTSIYLVSTGGNSDYAQGSVANSNIALLDALGACGNLGMLPALDVNEVVTVASVYALAPFMSGTTNSYLNVGTTSTNITGLVNAFADVPVLVDLHNASAPGAAPAGATIPIATINTLADGLAGCVNSGGGSVGDGTGCGLLFTAANDTTTAPTDTVTAIFNIATHPGANVSGVNNLANNTAPFQPILGPTPNDFTLAVTFSGGGLNKPSALAGDASGNMWVTNATGNTVTEYAHTGTVLSGSGYMASFNAPSAIAIDASDNVWVTNKGNNTVSRITGSTGAAVSGSPYSGGAMSSPSSIAFDSLDTAWISNSGSGAVTTITTTGNVASYTPAGATATTGIAVNPH